MNDCENCANYAHKHKERADVCDICVTAYVNEERQEPSHWKPMPMTNADRIRAMTDEELAEFLMKLMGHTQCFAEGMFPYHPCPQNHVCKECGIDWLKQPHGGADHEQA